MPRSCIAISILAAALAAAQTADLNIRVDTTLVVVPVTVTDSVNRFVLGLGKQDFRIFEDEKEQTITHFSGEDAPLSLGLLVDTSGSIGMKLDTSRDAVAELLKTMNSPDEAFLIEFNDRARLVQSFTGSTREIEDKLGHLQSGGLTALLDAVDLGLKEMKKAKNPRKALIVISDGGDNHSRYTQADIRNVVKEADVQLYAMGVFEPVYFATLTKEEVSGPKLLSQLSEQTGGRAFGASDSSQLSSIAEKIAIELRNQYVLAYTPKNQNRDGKYRRIEVKLNQPDGLGNLKARWRNGYYAPAQ